MKALLSSICFTLLMVCFITPYTIKASEIVEDGIEATIEETVAEDENIEKTVEGFKGEEAAVELPEAEEIENIGNGGLLSATSTGWVKSGGKWYYYSSNEGQLKRGIFWISEDAAYYGFWPDGSLVSGGWKKIDVEQSDGSYKKQWVYAGTGSKLLRGWQKIDGKWYYFNPSCPAAYENGIYSIGGKKYYFNSSCVMRTGWIKINSTTWLYADSSGALASGWKQIGGVWYYFNPSSRTMYYGGPYYIGGEKYYFADSGAMRTGWIRDDYKWYYATSSGKLATGWQKIGGKWYYFDKDTYDMYWDDIYEIGGKSYYFKVEGDIYVDGTYYYQTGRDYYWVTVDSNGVITKMEYQ